MEAFPLWLSSYKIIWFYRYNNTQILEKTYFTCKEAFDMEKFVYILYLSDSYLPKPSITLELSEYC